jgi:hypothetical protein
MRIGIPVCLLRVPISFGVAELGWIQVNSASNSTPKSKSTKKGIRQSAIAGWQGNLRLWFAESSWASY